MRYNNLQVARFAAAASILAYHVACHAEVNTGYRSALLGPTPAALFVSAAVFLFVLSGFVLAHVLQTSTLRQFLGRRLLRIYPAYWAVIGTAFLVRTIAGRQPPVNVEGLWYAASLWPIGPNRAAYTLGVEWTLVYEVLLSFAIIPFAACGRRWGLGLAAVVWLGLIVRNLIVRELPVFPLVPTPATFPLSAVNAAFLLGILVYLGQALFDRVRPLLPLLFVLGEFGGCYCIASGQGGWGLVSQSVGMAAAVGYLAGGRQLSAGWLPVRAGDWAYGIYLAHMPVIAAMFALGSSSGFGPVVLSTLAAGIALLAGCGYGWLEWACYLRLRSPPNKPVRVSVLSFPRPASRAP